MAKKKNNNEKQINDGSVIVLLKIDMHCEGCAGKIVKFVRSLDGVESVKRRENDRKEITVVGNVDPVELCEHVEGKIRKKVELITPATRKLTGDGGEQKKQLKQQTDAGKDESKHKKFPVTTTVLKVALHCGGCIKRIQELVKKTEGFVEMSIDKSNNLVTVKGAMDMNVLTTALKDKLHKKLEIVSANGGDGKKAKSGDGDGDGDGKERGSEGLIVEGYDYVTEYYVGQDQYMYPHYVSGPEYTFNYMHATQMFNDENVNACVVM